MTVPVFLESEARRLELPLECVFLEDGRLYLTPQGWRRLVAQEGVVEQLEVTRPTPQTVKVRVRLWCKAAPSPRTFEAESPLFGEEDPQSAVEIALCRAFRFFLGRPFGVEGDPSLPQEGIGLVRSNGSHAVESLSSRPSPSVAAPTFAERPERWKRAMRRCHAVARKRGIDHEMLSSCFAGLSMKTLEEEDLLASADLLGSRDLEELRRVFLALTVAVRKRVAGVKDLLKGQLGG